MKQVSYIILGLIIGGFLTYFFIPKMEQTPEKIVKPKGVISVEQATGLSDNWTKYRKQAVDAAAKEQGREEDDRSTYWTLEDIENYLGYAKHYSDSLGYKVTGLRVYLGVYGENAGETKKNLTTMFIAPIVQKSRSYASSVYMNFQKDKGPKVPPLNNSTGGNGGYPQ